MGLLKKRKACSTSANVSERQQGESEVEEIIRAGEEWKKLLEDEDDDLSDYEIDLVGK